MGRKVIALAVVGLVALGGFQFATGGVKPSVDFVEAKARCYDAVARGKAIRSGSPLPQSEGIQTYRLIVMDCRNKGFLINASYEDVSF
ncbi:hypothetical protein [Mesorhizobium captivum]|uniref:Uncharacterized protein n=1 Tax=Mesorhizobium captivum TaxID=3072319 RepID=A0ABU4YWN7_9HYPH|nr:MULTISPECIES: hypothetical protein [unclassified Mesorhizobium]MDX8445094.1 hypothetical protein [Mesorhizobium sp. VK3C]MDX8491387.1 hypothetical protein [Mesorhizobium sp. VK22B]MDX8505804.1 hypothetical protein [Mesorhizobium sp. VK22E]